MSTSAHQLPPIPQRPFASSDAEAQTKPVYRPGDDPLPFTRNVRFAALDVMILTYAARRHAEWLASIGACPDDVAKVIRNDVEDITRLLLTPPAPTPTASPSPDVGPRPPRPARAKDAPTSLWDATRGDVGETDGGAKVAEKNGP